MADFYLIWAMSDEPPRTDKHWWEEFLRVHGFSCGHYDFNYFPDEVVIEEYGQDLPLNFTSKPLLQYVREDLLDALSPEIEEAFTLGELVHVVDGEIANGRTLWSTRRVQIRAGKKSTCSRCEVCGQVVYDARGRWYALISDLVGSPIFLGSDGGIIVNEELHGRLKGRRWKKVDISKLTVLDKPRDGFPVNLETITPEQERKWTPPRML